MTSSPNLLTQFEALRTEGVQLVKVSTATNLCDLGSKLKQPELTTIKLFSTIWAEAALNRRFLSLDMKKVTMVMVE